MAQVLASQGGMHCGDRAMKRSARRRATSHRRFRRSQRPASRNAPRCTARAGGAHSDKPQSSSGTASAPATAADTVRPLNRRMRRAAKHLGSMQHASELSRAAHAKRLPAHAWLVKRFVMCEDFGWLLPEHMHGKGHRWRSLRKALHSAALLHDASHYASLHAQAATVSTLQRALRAVLLHHPVAPDDQHGSASAMTDQHDGELELRAGFAVLVKRCGAALGPCEHSGIEQDQEGAHVTLRVHPAIAESTKAALRHAVADGTPAHSWRVLLLMLLLQLLMLLLLLNLSQVHHALSAVRCLGAA